MKYELSKFTWKPGSGSHLASRKERASNGKEIVHLIIGRVEKVERKTNSCNSVEDFNHFMTFQGSKPKCLIYRICTGNEQVGSTRVQRPVLNSVTSLGLQEVTSRSLDPSFSSSTLPPSTASKACSHGCGRTVTDPTCQKASHPWRCLSSHLKSTPGTCTIASSILRCFHRNGKLLKLMTWVTLLRALNYFQTFFLTLAWWFTEPQGCTTKIKVQCCITERVCRIGGG